MRLSLLLALLLVLCAAVVLSQEYPAGERPPTADSSVEIDENQPEKPSSSSSDNPERPADSSSSSFDDNSQGGSACMMLAMMCPDGSYATQNSECQYICGAAPTGNLNFTYVASVMAEFDAVYNPHTIYISTMAYKNITLRPPEKATDYCIEVGLTANDYRQFPAVYKSVRVFYTRDETPSCSPQMCADGSVVGCYDVCPPDNESSSFFMPFALVFGVVLLSACCCCIRRRRCKKAAACNPTSTQPVSPINAYPAEYYELLQQEQFVGQTPLEMPPQIMSQPMLFPPMPPVPPHMMQSGAFPIMIQAPNGVWYMAPPHPEDA